MGEGVVEGAPAVAEWWWIAVEAQREGFDAREREAKRRMRTLLPGGRK